MTANHPPDEPARPPAPPGDGADAGKTLRALRLSFCVMVMLLAVFQFSENSTDPDLWGHVVFGQDMLKTRSIAKTEIYSWTAQGQPWVNHECLAEISLGLAHRLLGGTGLLLLKMGIGLLTFALCLCLGGAELSWPSRYVAWGLGALAVVEISYGFAARPQIFTALFLAVELLLLRRIHAGAYRWAWAVPPLFLIWINTHGGVLAGFGLLGLTAGMTTAQFLFGRSRGNGTQTSPSLNERPTARAALILWPTLAGALVALFCNPWGPGLIRWLIGSVLWLRPEIQEWNPTPLAWDHAAFFILVAVTVFAWVGSRRPRAWWEWVACAAFAVLALRSVRNAPLFCVVTLALTPPHLADALARFREHFGRWEMLVREAGFQRQATNLFGTIAIGVVLATFILHKEHPLTMEVARSKYPVGALAFMKENELHGRILVFFDWGEQVIFELPDSQPSIDGRLDTCYSRELIAAHWQFYNGKPYDEKLLNLDRADFALLPANLAGGLALKDRPGWRPVYYDDTAVLLVRDLGRFPKLRKLAAAVDGSKAASLGQAAFPDHNPRLN